MNDRKIEIHVWEVNVGPVRTSDSGRNKPEKQTANANDTLGYFMYQMYSVHCTDQPGIAFESSECILVSVVNRSLEGNRVVTIQAHVDFN